MLGNVCIWKPSPMAIHSGYLIAKIFKEAGLPDGVIQFLPVLDPTPMCKIVFNHSEFASLHFTGSTKVFKSLWKEIGNNIDRYKSYPRIVGETGKLNHAKSSSPLEKKPLWYQWSSSQVGKTSISYINLPMYACQSSRLFAQHSSIRVRDQSHFYNAELRQYVGWHCLLQAKNAVPYHAYTSLNRYGPQKVVSKIH